MLFAWLLKKDVFSCGRVWLQEIWSIELPFSTSVFSKKTDERVESESKDGWGGAKGNSVTGVIVQFEHLQPHSHERAINSRASQGWKFLLDYQHLLMLDRPPSQFVESQKYRNRRHSLCIYISVQICPEWSCVCHQSGSCSSVCFHGYQW